MCILYTKTMPKIKKTREKMKKTQKKRFPKGMELLYYC